MARLQDRYFEEIVPALRKELGRDNLLSLPRLSKIVISMGLGQAILEKKRMTNATEELAVISGQRPVVTKARKSVSGFKVRQGMDVGAKVTLRRKRMYEFLDRLINVAIPRIRDFRGLSPRAFDGRGNYSMGLQEQTVFPEIEADKVDAIHGMDITVCTSARRDEDALALLKALGMPFRDR